MIHLAWQDLPNYKDFFHFEKNLPMHYQFLKLLIEQGINDLIVAGTCLEYAMKDGCLTENTDTNPDNSYGLAKDTLRKFLNELQKKEQFAFKWTRLFYIYGRGQAANSLIPQLETALKVGDKFFNMSGGEQVSDYLSVEKVSEYIVKIALQEKVTGLINCSSGIPITVKNFVETYLESRQKKITLNLGYYPYPDYEPMKFLGDNKKLSSIVLNSNY